MLKYGRTPLLLEKFILSLQVESETDLTLHYEKPLGNNVVAPAAVEIGGDHNCDPAFLTCAGLRPYVGVVLLSYGEGFRLQIQ